MWMRQNHFLNHSTVLIHSRYSFNEFLASKFVNVCSGSTVNSHALISDFLLESYWGQRHFFKKNYKCENARFSNIKDRDAIFEKKISKICQVSISYLISAKGLSFSSIFQFYHLIINEEHVIFPGCPGQIKWTLTCLLRFHFWWITLFF